MTRYDIARMCGYNSVEEYDEAEKRKHEIFTESLKKQKPYVEKEPVKIQPTKHGRWIISNLYAQCSECSVAYDLDTFQRLIPMNENVPRHCAYCGARMDGDTNG